MKSMSAIFKAALFLMGLALGGYSLFLTYFGIMWWLDDGGVIPVLLWGVLGLAIAFLLFWLAGTFRIFRGAIQEVRDQRSN